MFLRYGFGVPFPHNYGKLRNPDISTYKNINNKLENGDKLDIVLGEKNIDLLDKEVADKLIDKIKNCKKIELRIIVGPEIHLETRDFFKQLFDYPDKIKVYIKPTTPLRHFRLLHNKQLILEPSHKKFEYSKFWKFSNSKYLNRKYEKIFNIYIKNSYRCTNVNDIGFKSPTDKL